MAIFYERHCPDKAGNDYFVSGTVDRRVWSAGLQGHVSSRGTIFDHVADFKEHMELHYEPGGWRPTGEAPHKGE